jgi:hypothetical protein
MGVSHVAARAILTGARESLRRALAVEKEAERTAERSATRCSPARPGAADDLPFRRRHKRRGRRTTARGR